MQDFRATRRVDKDNRPQFLEHHRVRLVITDGPGAGLIYPVTQGRIVIGRSWEAHIPIQDDLISRFHAVISPANEGCEIRDLKRANGTFVNEERVDLHSLHDGDAIRIGKTVLRYVVERIDHVPFSPLAAR